MINGRQLNIKLLDLCNAACSFCGYNKERLKERIRGGYVAQKVDVPRLLERLPLLKKKGIGVLHLTGGEPTLHPDFGLLVAGAKAQGFQIRTGTNGSLLDAEKIGILKRSGVDFLWYSLDTFPFEKHLEHRGFTALERRMREGIRLLLENRINFFGQTVLSRILPQKDGLPDIEGHMDYYRREFGIRRFVFSYPMHRPEGAASGEGGEEDVTHLATLGSEAVAFSSDELKAIFARVMEVKKRRRDLVIVNPYVSLWQRLRETEGKESGIGCHAGRDIFFLHRDEESLSPCYHFSTRVVDRLDGKPLKAERSYLDCRSCNDQCFRDPSVLYAAANRPISLLKQAVREPAFALHLARDLTAALQNRGYRHV